MYKATLDKLQVATVAFEKTLNKIFTQQYNPFYYHGAIPNYLLWILLLSGLALFVYYQPTLDSAYISVNYLSENVPFGQVIRGIHRYGADAMMIGVLIHAIRVFFTDRYRKYRWIAWYSGVALLLGMLIIGITGYVLVWDERSYMIVLMMTDALKSIPLIGMPLAEMFVNGKVITHLTLSMSFFLHVGISFLLLFLLWLHYLRISRPVSEVPLGLGLGLFALLMVPAGVYPAGSGAPAVLTKIPNEFPVDWFYLWIFPLFSSMPALIVWTILFIAIAVTLALPYLITDKPKSPAIITLDNCVGCTLCAKDCPYEAIYMIPRDDGSKYKQLAVVIEPRCSECGLCVGACAFKAIELSHEHTKDTFGKIQDVLQETVTT